MYSMDVPPWGTSPTGLGQTYVWGWADNDDNYIKMAAFTVFCYVPEYCSVIPLRYRLLIMESPVKMIGTGYG